MKYFLPIIIGDIWNLEIWKSGKFVIGPYFFSRNANEREKRKICKHVYNNMEEL